MWRSVRRSSADEWQFRRNHARPWRLRASQRSAPTASSAPRRSPGGLVHPDVVHAFSRGSMYEDTVTPGVMMGTVPSARSSTSR